MKAIRVAAFGGPEVLKPTDVPDLTPGAGQILVQVKAAGVNPVETYIRAGTYARKPELPYTPGSDGAGIIEAIGEGVSGFKVGQRVYLAGSLSGTYAEQTLCEPVHVHPLPENASFADGAALGTPYVTAHFALFFRARAKAGETILIHGATGGVGLAAVQWARRAGFRTIGTGGSEAGRVVLTRQGVDLVVDHTDLAYLDQLMKFTEGRGVDVILEMLANVNLAKDLTLLAPYGRVAVIGSRGPIEINPRDAMTRNAEILGVMLFGAPTQVLADIHEQIAEGLEAGTLQPVVGRELPLAEAAEAHRSVMTSGACGKIVLLP